MKRACQTCVQCGCDDSHACRLADGTACYWMLEDLCSNPACMDADPRTPGPFDDSAWPMRAPLVRAIEPEAIPPVSAVPRVAFPPPPAKYAALFQRVPLRWLLRLAFSDPAVLAVEVHPWAAGGGRGRRTSERFKAFRLRERRGRFFFVRDAYAGAGGKEEG